MTTIELDRRPRMSMYCTIAFASISAALEYLNLSADEFIALSYVGAKCGVLY